MQYDNVLMEEAAQILEVETFVPLMLQNPQDGHNRLKRVIMIGDHHQVGQGKPWGEGRRKGEGLGWGREWEGRMRKGEGGRRKGWGVGEVSRIPPFSMELQGTTVH